MHRGIVLFAFLGIWSTLASAQETKPVPAYEDYLPGCVDQAEAAESEGVFGSSIDREIAVAMCQCKFDHFPKNGVMTKNQFFNSALVCNREQEHDSLEFTQKYLSRFKKNSK